MTTFKVTEIKTWQEEDGLGHVTIKGSSKRLQSFEIHFRVTDVVRSYSKNRGITAHYDGGSGRPHEGRLIYGSYFGQVCAYEIKKARELAANQVWDRPLTKV